VAIDARGQDSQDLRAQEPRRIAGHPRGVADLCVPHQEGQLRRLHEAMDMVEALAFGHPQAVEQRQDHQGGEPLRRGRKIEQFGVADLD
jgi:hypothetical protein